VAAAAAGLFSHPALERGAGVADVASDLEVGRAGFLVDPVAQGRFGYAEDLSDFAQGEQVVEGVVDGMAIIDGPGRVPFVVAVATRR
jgi:hypothetical protein